jgi:1-acyl-sn-glycerol-3-phosphate acyltransferase
VRAPWHLAPLARRIASARADTAARRDPDFVRRLLPAVTSYTNYFSPEVRGLGNLPTSGPVLVVGNHSCLFYMPEVWISGRAITLRRGIDQPLYLLAYDLLFAAPGVASVIHRLGAVPASTQQAQAALEGGACLLVYPGGDWEACRPWTQRDKVDFANRKGFVRLALRCAVPVVPAVTHGGHDAVIVLTRGERLASAAGLPSVRIKVFPILAGLPFGVTSILAPPLPMPAQVTVEFLPAVNWSRYGSGAADNEDIVAACYEEITGVMQAALKRLRAERPHPLLQGSVRLVTRCAAVLPSGRRPGR